MITETKPKISGACPTFFRASCREASRGGSGGYKNAAWNLAGHVHGLIEWDSDEERASKLECLDELFLPPSGIVDADAVLAWFDRELPRCMALVPRKRRGAFVEGLEGWTKEENNFSDC